jgi:two-component system, OmpR family, response regulator CpxR
MAIISITNGLYSNATEIIDLLAKQLGCKIVTDGDIMERTSKKQQLKLTNLLKTVDSKNIAFNDFTHEKERCIAGLRRTVSEYVLDGNCIFQGILGHLIPDQVAQVLKVLIITDKEHRLANGVKKESLSKSEVSAKIKSEDQKAILWTNMLHKKKAWDEKLYDIVIPTDKMVATNAADLIIKHAEMAAKQPEEVLASECRNFNLSAEIDFALASLGADLSLKVENGNVMVSIEKNVMKLSRLKRKIIDIAKNIEGVKNVEVTLGGNFYDFSFMRRYEFETPTRILLVDDEKEFVQTLSERLKMRELQNEIVYSGQNALDYTNREDVEVMVLDLKMPGIDGFEVLKKVKTSKPNIEVIILTGHGSEEDRKTCMKLGAFAYLQKPADIDLLTSTMKKAYEKIAENQ